MNYPYSIQSIKEFTEVCTSYYFRKSNYDYHLRYNRSALDYHLKILSEWFKEDNITIRYKHKKDSIEFEYLDRGNWVFIMEYYHDTGYVIPIVFKINNFKSFLYSKITDCIKEYQKQITNKEK